MIIKIEMLRTFVAVAECKNLADAATRLGRTVSAVSMMLKLFEENLGKPLFETDRKNRLSPLGAFVLEQAEGQLLQFDNAVIAIERYAQSGAGTVRIASVPSVAGTILPLAFKTFAATHPGVQIEMRDMDSTSVLRALEKELADIGIAAFPKETSAFQKTRLFTDSFGLVCRHDHRLAGASEPLDWQALEQEVLIANELCGTIRDPTFQTIYGASTISVHNTISLLAMVNAGLGVTILPFMAESLTPPGVVYRAIGNSPVQRHIDLLHKPSERISPATSKMADHIVSACGNFLDDDRKRTDPK